MAVALDVHGPDFHTIVEFEVVPRVGEEIFHQYDTGQWMRFIVTAVGHYPSSHDFQAAITIVPAP